MRALSRLTIIAFISLLPACATTSAPPAAAPSALVARAAVMTRLQDFMNRYEQNDQAGVIALLDKREFTILGGSIMEKARTPDEVKALMTRSFEMWKSARFTDIRDIDPRVGTDLATVSFLFSFTGGDGYTIPIRVVTAWRKDAGEWYLTQCASWMPER